MKLTSILSRIMFCTPLMAQSQPALPPITASTGDEYLDYLAELLGNADEMETVGTVAVIPVKGILALDAAPIETALAGICDYERVARDLQTALADKSITGIVLNIDSPGGQATGALELASQIADAVQQKPIVAWTDTVMCSAAYYIAAGCSAIVATPSAIVGSVGSYMTLYDVSEMFAKMGIETVLLASGEHKGAGQPGTSLSEEQTTHLQSVIDALGLQFRNFVKLHRDVKNEDLRGQYFEGDRALALGFLDDTGSLPDAIALARNVTV
jgi:signal peptide peptidase SppA